jgi:hypothetical protein
MKELGKGKKKVVRAVQRAPKLQRQVTKILPAARTVESRSTQAVYSALKEGLLVSHSEYLCDVVSTGTAYNTISKAVNAAHVTFPWLHKLGDSFEKYKFRSLRVDYKPTVGTTATGTVVLAMDYDPLDAVPASKSRALSYHGAVRAVPWNEVGMPVVPMKEALYTRKAGLPANADKKTYDYGNLHICMDGVAVGTCGEIHVSYVCELLKPQSADSGEGAYLTGSTDMALFRLFGSDVARTGSSRVDPTMYPAGLVTGQAVTLHGAGRWYVAARITGTGLTTPAVQNAADTTTWTYNSGYQDATSVAAMIVWTLDFTTETAVFAPELTAFTTGTTSKFHFAYAP